MQIFSSCFNLALHLSEDDDVGGAGHVVNVGGGRGIKITFIGKVQERRLDQLRILNEGERTTLKCYLEEYRMRVQLIQDMAFCEHRYERSDILK
jgi:hypothetical protein